MNFLFLAIAVVVAVLIFFTVGCTTNAPFRKETKDWIESTPEYKLGFVEFDDQGWFWDQRQVKAVEELIRNESGVGQSANRRGVVIVAFAHGWKNNAAPDNANVEMFRATLKQLGAAELAQTNHAPRKVVGVYAGWRGLSATIEPFKELSFWNRKKAAHKVGGYGAMTELLVDLERLQQDSNEDLATNVPRTELIIVGHSFGGAAVYSAISQIVTERFVDTIKRGKPLKPLGDQVILLNPAFEASRHYDLNQMAVYIEQYPANQRPVLSIFTSKGDWATHYFFPLGRYFSTLFEKNRDKQQKKANRAAVGWFNSFITHSLDYKASAEATAQGVANVKVPTKREPRSGAQLKAAIHNVQMQRAKWRPNNREAQTYYFQDSILRPSKDYRPGDPILVVAVDKKIMKDHGDITNPVLIDFLGEYILFCQKEPNRPAEAAPAK
jgi:alpha-beta hydrolase superfamily lysophospholipase